MREIHCTKPSGRHVVSDACNYSFLRLAFIFAVKLASRFSGDGSRAGDDNFIIYLPVESDV
jgi:hypothetical protein